MGFPEIVGPLEGVHRSHMGMYRVSGLGFRVSQNLGYHVGHPKNRDYRALGFTSGSPYLETAK